MHDCKQKDCKHQQTKFCSDCGKVYCLKCDRVWPEKEVCTLPHYQWTYTPNWIQGQPVFIPSVWSADGTYNDTGVLTTTHTITCKSQ